MSFPRFDYEAIIFCTSNDEMMLNQLRIVRWLETSIIIVLPILLQKKRVKPKKAWSS